MKIREKDVYVEDLEFSESGFAYVLIEKESFFVIKKRRTSISFIYRTSR